MYLCLFANGAHLLKETVESANALVWEEKIAIPVIVWLLDVNKTGISNT